MPDKTDETAKSTASESKRKVKSSTKAPVKTVKKTGKASPEAVAKKKKEENAEGVDDDEEEVEIVDDDDDEAKEAVYTPKLKPKLTKSQKRLLKIKRQRKSEKPTFRRQEWFRYKRLGDSYRKPKGLHSKMRKNVRYRLNMARIGYGSNRSVRDLHPSGFEEVMVFRPGDLEGLDPKKQAARIGHQVGTRKRIAIEDKADKLGIRILNRGAV